MGGDNLLLLAGCVVHHSISSVVLFQKIQER